MRQCIQCGKKGLFLWLSKSGYCEKCAQKIYDERERQKEMQRQAEQAEKERIAEAERVRAAKEAEERERAAREEARRRIDEMLEKERREKERFNETLSFLAKAEIVLNGVKRPIKATTDLSNGLSYSMVTKRSSKARLANFVSIDVETTGINLAQSNIIEVSAIKFDNFVPTKIFTTLIKPTKEIPASATEINGITNQMVEDSPFFYQIVPSLQDFISGYNIVGHNLSFDLKFLYRGGLDMLAETRRYYDTLSIARRTLKAPKRNYNYYCDDDDDDDDVTYEYDVENHKLDTLCQFYHILRDNAHRASSDCLATGMLFKHLVDDIIL